MNLKEYYKQLLSEELKKVTPQEAARIRAEKKEFLSRLHMIFALVVLAEEFG